MAAITPFFPRRKPRDAWSRGFMRLAGSMDDPVCLWRIDGRIILSNDAMKAIMPSPPDNKTGRQAPEFYPGIMEDVIQNISADNTPRFTEVRQTDPSGGIRRIRWKTSRIGGRGRKLHFLSTGTFITGHRAEEEAPPAKAQADPVHIIKARTDNREYDPYRKLMEFLPIGVTVMNRKGRILEMNRLCRNFLGVTGTIPEKAGSIMKAWRFIRPDSSAMTPAEFPVNLAAEQDEPVNMIMGIHRPDEPLSWLAISAVPLPDIQDRIVIAYQDITEKKNAVDLLAQSEQRYRELFGAISTGVVVCTYSESGNDFVIREFNLSAQTITEMPVEKVLGRGVSMVFSGTRTSGILDTMKRVWETGIAEHRDALFYRDHAIEGWITCNAYRLSSGEIVTLFDDVTEKITARDRILASEERLRSVIQNMPVMLMALDGRGDILIWNRECERVTGYSIDDFRAPEKFLEHLCPDPGYRKSIREEWDKRGNSFKNWEWRIICRDGSTKYISWSSNSSGNPVPGWAEWGIAVDITDQRQAEFELERLNSELEARVLERTRELETANRELESFSYSVSHDLRAPLRHILSFTDLILEEYPELMNEGLKRYIDIIGESAENMSVLIEALLDFSRTGRSELRSIDIDLTALISRSVASFAEEIYERDVSVSVSPVPPVFGDPALLNVVFSNLLSNAIKFTRGRDNPAVWIDSTSGKGVTYIHVRDNGVGFDMKYAGRLFGVFQRLHRDNEFEGTGIGLATVQRIVHRHGWQITADSHPGQGAAFHIIIPSAAVLTVAGSG